MQPLLLPNHCVLDKHWKIWDNLGDVKKKPSSKCFRVSPNPLSPLLECMSDIIFPVMCPTLPSGQIAARQAHVDLTPQETHTWKPSCQNPSQGKSGSVSWQLPLFADGVNMDPEWDVLEMSLALAHFLSPSSSSFFPLCFFLFPLLCSSTHLFSFSYNHLSVSSSAFGSVHVETEELSPGVKVTEKVHCGYKKGLPVKC